MKHKAIKMNKQMMSTLFPISPIQALHFSLYSLNCLREVWMEVARHPNKDSGSDGHSPLRTNALYWTHGKHQRLIALSSNCVCTVTTLLTYLL